VKAAGFRLRHSTSFVTPLLPLMLFSRLHSKKTHAEFDPKDEFDMPSRLDALLYAAMLVEIGLIRMGLNFPAGGSRLLVAQKAL